MTITWINRYNPEITFHVDHIDENDYHHGTVHYRHTSYQQTAAGFELREHWKKV